MAILLEFDAYIVSTSDPSTHLYNLGKWYSGVVVDDGLSSLSPQQIPLNDFDYFADYVDDIIFFGGTIQINGSATSIENAAILPQYVPLSSTITIPSEYQSANYRTKLVNPDGSYALSAVYTASGSANGSFTIYDKNGTKLNYGDFIISVNTSTLGNNNVFENICIVDSNSIVDGVFVSGARVFGITVQFSRYWSKAQYKALTTDEINWFNCVKRYQSNADPYEQGGTSTTGGGTGTFTIDSDAISIPNPPTLSAVDTGLVSLYTPTLAQLQALAAYLWNADATTVDWWKKLIANPLDLILGLSIVPVAVPTSGAVSVKVGLIDTQIQMNKASSQYVQVDCGTLNVVEFYGAALDYLPFRKTSIYLPFIGTRTISTDDIMGKALQVVYNIDLLSGALTAMIKCGDAVLYQYSGSCAMSIPLTGQTFTDMITSTIQLAAGIGATVASGGAAAGVVAANAANSVMSMKPTVERAGGVSGAAGQLAIMKPYLIGEIPRQSVPENYNQFAGYPSNIKATLSDLSGYTEIETVYLEGIAATDSELNEIETLLKGGVFL